MAQVLVFMSIAAWAFAAALAFGQDAEGVTAWSNVDVDGYETGVICFDITRRCSLGSGNPTDNMYVFAAGPMRLGEGGFCFLSDQAYSSPPTETVEEQRQLAPLIDKDYCFLMNVDGSVSSVKSGERFTRDSTLEVEVQSTLDGAGYSTLPQRETSK